MKISSKNVGEEGPFYRGAQKVAVGGEKVLPRVPGLGPAWPARNQNSIKGRQQGGRPEPGLGWPNCRKTPNTKTNIF